MALSLLNQYGSTIVARIRYDVGAIPSAPARCSGTLPEARPLVAGVVISG